MKKYMDLDKKSDFDFSDVNVGDEIWACAFEYESTKEGTFLMQEPVLGQFVSAKTEKEHLKNISNDEKLYISHFVPYKKNGKDLAWSKAVLIRNRMYATTKEECTEMFNESIKDKINWHLQELEKLNKMFIK